MFLQAARGEFKPLAAPLGPDACRVSYTHQGLGRYVHVYLPPSYDGETTFPLWVHLHGVFWTTMGDIGKMVGHAVNGTDVIPKWDHSVELLGDKAIIVYPQSLGDPGTGDEAVDGQGDKYRQFWHIPFWRCSVGICRPPDLDDVGFIEEVMADLPQRLPVTPNKLYLSGESAGGMLVQTLLCESPAVSSAITAAVDMLGGIGVDYAAGPECVASPAVPFLKLHGTADPSITFDKRILVDGVNFLSAIEATQQRAKHNGCSPSDAGAETTDADEQMICTDYCEKAAGKPTAKACGMLGVGHTTDFPHPGFVFEQSWLFFEQQAKLAQTVKKPQVAAAAAVAVRKTAAQTAAAAATTQKSAPEAAIQGAMAATAEVTGPLTLNITFPGTTLPDFQSNQASKALAAVSEVTGVPTPNITAALYSAPGIQRRTLLQQLDISNPTTAATAAAVAADLAGVIASYKLSASNPSDVANILLKAVQDGSLLQSLTAQGLTAPGSAPLVSLSAVVGDGKQKQQRQLLEPVDLSAAALSTQQDYGIDSQSGSAATTATAVNNSPGDQPSSSRNSNVGVIVGSVIGGVVGAALLAGIAIVVAKQRRSRNLLPSSVISDQASGRCSTVVLADSDSSSTISSSTSCGNLKAVDVVMHVIDEEAASVKDSKSGNMC